MRESWTPCPECRAPDLEGERHGRHSSSGRIERSLRCRGDHRGAGAPRAWVWNWADAVYYPIAIVGVVLLFISNERSRSLDALQRDVGDAERRIADQEKTKPEFNAHNFQPVFLDSSYGLLKSEIDLGDACARIPDVTIKCITAKKRAEIAHCVFDGFKIPKTLAEDTSTAETIKDFCDRGYKYIDALQTNVPIDNSVYGASRLRLPT